MGMQLKVGMNKISKVGWARTEKYNQCHLENCAMIEISFSFQEAIQLGWKHRSWNKVTIIHETQHPYKMSVFSFLQGICKLDTIVDWTVQCADIRKLEI